MFGQCLLDLQILGKVMDLNCFTCIFSLVLVEQKRFAQSHPPIPPHLPHVTPLAKTTMLMQGGG